MRDIFKKIANFVFKFLCQTKGYICKILKLKNCTRSKDDSDHRAKNNNHVKRKTFKHKKHQRKNSNKKR